MPVPPSPVSIFAVGDDNGRPACTVLRPARQMRPLVLSSPHSGRRYDSRFLAQTRLEVSALRRSEDAHVDALLAALPARLGVPLIQALFPRTYVDANREPLELDPTMFEAPLPRYVNTASPRVRAGLGTIPRLAANGAAIYGARLSFAEARARLRGCYFPYHRALTELVAETRRRFGYALLIDCHSMPSQAVTQARPGNDFVLGDRHGAACMPELSDRAEAVLRELGYSVARNRPYAGGFTTHRHGRPDDGVHTLQIEVNRALYLDETRLRPHDGSARLAADLEQLIDALAEVIPFARAAE